MSNIFCVSLIFFLPLIKQVTQFLKDWKLFLERRMGRKRSISLSLSISLSTQMLCIISKTSFTCKRVSDNESYREKRKNYIPAGQTRSTTLHFVKSTYVKALCKQLSINLMYCLVEQKLDAIYNLSGQDAKCAKE